ncbi:hypothetical protein [Nocardioides sp. AE5]|uniref:hypothetical protein n=1 Tax=Nocardioides sp. AE5 TaxID=2962573 RepID=UPI002881801C|nr:hypothetical protein [Nocardioides sp. AE5]MDT0203976.1 hypothetical protein [Nocardioides sp. AE5]
MSTNQPPPNGWGPGSYPNGPQSYATGPGSYPGGPGSYASGPGGYPAGPGGPPPKSGRAGLIAAIVALVLVVTAVAVALVVTLTGDDDDTVAGTENTTQASSSPSTSDEPTEKNTSGPTDGRMTGAFYSYAMPDGWNDVTDDLTGQPTVDTISGDGSGVYSSRMHLMVELGSTFGFATAEELKETWKATLTGGDTTRQVTDLPDTTVDGEPAVRVRIDHPPTGNVTAIQFGWLLIVDGRAVSIVLTTYAEEDPSLAVAKQILDSWQWE